MPDTGSSAPRPLIGLALGAGVARGWAHIGVLRALASHGIVPDIVAGCSIGALVGGVHLAGRLDELEDWARNLSRMRIVSYLDLRVRAGGLIGGQRLVAELRRRLGPLTIESFETPFAAIATDLVSGHEVWLRKGDLVDALRASFSLPGVFAPVQIGHRWLVDGALVNPIPVSTCRALGADVVIAVNLNADLIGKARRHRDDVPVGEVPDLFTLIEGEQAPRKPSRFDALSRRVFQRGYDGPSLFGVMVSSLGIIQDRISRSRMAGEPPDVHVTPRLGHIGLLEFDRAAEAISEGEASLLRALPDLQDAITVFMRQYAR